MKRRIVGAKELADLLNVARGTPAKWAQRPSAQLPDPDHPPVNGRPAWELTTILEWARRTNRLPEEQ